MNTMWWRFVQLLSVFAISALSLFHGIDAAPSMKTSNPIIGIVTLPASQCSREASGHCIVGNYVKWLVSAGAQIVPIKYDLPLSELRTLQQRVNGILFTGGGLDLTYDSSYLKTARAIFNLATSNPSDYFPVWGTCMGFQTLHIVAAWNTSVLCEYCYDSSNVSWPLILEPKSEQSRFFNALPPQAIVTLATQPVTFNYHHDGIELSAYTRWPKLASFFDILSSNVDKQGRAFISTVEAKQWPIYGIQWHAERNQFTFEPDRQISHTPEAIFAMQNVANFFVNEARRNGHSFPSQAELQAALIENIAPVNQGFGELVYIFD